MLFDYSGKLYNFWIYEGYLLPGKLKLPFLMYLFFCVFLSCYSSYQLVVDKSAVVKKLCMEGMEYVNKSSFDSLTFDYLVMH